MFRSFGRFLRTLLLAFIGFCLLLLVLSLLPRRLFIAPGPCDIGYERLHVINHGYHTGIVVRRGTPNFEWLDSLEAPAQYSTFEIGWGDRDFYMASGRDVWLGVKALLTPTDAVMHVVGIPDGNPAEIFTASQVREVAVCRSKLADLSNFMRDSFTRNGNKSTAPLDKGLYGGWSAFYPAEGTYSLIYTCNSWTAEALDIAGLGAPVWGGAAQSIMFHLP